MSIVHDVQRILDDARALIEPLTPADLTTATPCEGWDIRALVGHMVGVCQGFATALGGDVAGGHDTDVRSGYLQVTDVLIRQIHAPEALDRMIDLPFGTMPAANGLGILLADQMLHTWDLATALGRAYAMDERLAAATLQGMRQLVRPEYRGPGKPFGPEVPCADDAPIQDRLLAFSGRRP